MRGLPTAERSGAAEKRQIMQIIDTFIERSKLKQRIYEKEAS